MEKPLKRSDKALLFPARCEYFKAIKAQRFSRRVRHRDIRRRWHGNIRERRPVSTLQRPTKLHHVGLALLHGELKTDLAAGPFHLVDAQLRDPGDSMGKVNNAIAFTLRLSAT